MSHDIRDDTLVVTGLGMASSLGRYTAGCAAARAGIVRTSELEFLADDPLNFEAVLVNGHSCGWLTRGFAETGRLVRLGSLALQDLFTRGEADPTDLADCGVVLSTATGYYLAQAHRKLLEDREGSDDTPADAVAEEPFEYPYPYAENTIHKILRAAGVTSVPGAVHMIFEDEAALIPALEAATSWIRSGQVARCLVGAVDSPVDGHWLSSLARLGILKTVTQPVGLMPGEAGVFLVLEPYGLARRRAAHIHAAVRGWVVRQEPQHRFSEPVPIGFEFARVILEACGVATAAHGLYSSANGDSVRSAEWGVALSRLLGEGFTPAGIVDPVASFGHVGAAHGFVALSMAAHSWVRGYGAAPTATLCLASDSGVRGAVAIGRA